MIRAAFIENFDPISNGLDHKSQSSILELNILSSTTVTCESTYGFFPCTTGLWGQLFLVVIYEYLLFLGEKYVSSGSVLFFKIFGTGIFGASLFHILGTIPHMAILLVTGISGSTETAEGLASMGIGMLAGSAVMSLTLVWGSCVAFGSYDLSEKTGISSTLENEKPFSLTGFGVTTDDKTSNTARIMLLSMIPFLILQLPKILNSTSATRVAILVSVVITLVFLFVYCIYQMFQPWIQNRRLEYFMRNYVKDNLIQCLLTPNGNPSKPIIRQLFHEIDQNKDQKISIAELRSLILGIQLEGVGVDKDNYVAKVMQEFDTSRDGYLIEEEFIGGIAKWLSQANLFAKKTGEEPQRLVPQRKENQGADNSWFNYFKATFLLLVGTTILVFLAEPLMEAVQDFATAANIPSFFVSYVVIPLAMNYRGALSAITSARKKTKTAVSLTFSEIYGGVFMNNMMGLAMFLPIVYIRDLSWNASTQVLVVLIIGVVMGFFTSFYTKFSFWTSIVAYLLYPISLSLLYVLATVLG